MTEFGHGDSALDLSLRLIECTVTVTLNFHGAIMRRPQFYVDFNELIEKDLVALLASDEKLSTSGEKILLQDGLAIDIYSDDLNDEGKPDNLIASGIVERNFLLGWAKEIKWCCRIDAQGIRHESEIER
jgi:hypothetical protein